MVDDLDGALRPNGVLRPPDRALPQAPDIAPSKLDPVGTVFIIFIATTTPF